MRTLRALGFVAVTSVFLNTGSASAQSGSWSALASGNWGTATNWSGSVIANGADNTATFATANLTVPITVTLNTSRTIGNLVFDNPTNNLGWTVRSNTLTLSASAGPNIAVNNANITATVTSTLAGTQGFTKSGAGTLSLSSNNAGLTGGINVAAGVLAVSGSAGINPLGTNTVTLSGGTLRLGSGGGFNQRMVVPVGNTFANSGITATMDGGTNLTGATWYELGNNVAAPTTGLPMGTTVTSGSNPQFSYTLQPATSRNAMLLDSAGGNTTGRFTLASPTALSQVSFLTSSGNAGTPTPTITATLHYSDGTPDATGLTFNSPDWFFVNTNIALIANGRISAGGYDSVNSGNPRLYDAFFNNPNPASPIASIDLSWAVGGSANAHTAIFGVNTPVLNGDPAQNFGGNNVVVTADSTIDVRPVAGATVGNVSIGTNTLSATGINGTTLTLGGITMTGNPTLNVAAGLTASAGAISDGGTVRTLTKAGTGTLILTTASPGLTAGAGFVVSAGTVNLNNATALGSAANVTINGGTFSLGAGVSPTLASLGGTSGSVALNGNTLTLGSASASFAGSIANGSAPGSLVKSGAGTQTLAGASSYSGGTTVSAGTLAVTGAGGLGTGPVNLTGGTLSVAGGPPVVTVTGFGGTGTGWTANGTASFPGADVLELTPNAGGSAGSAWNNVAVPTRGFTAHFTYTVPSASAPPADGFTFTLQNQGPTALGPAGGSLGYETITPSAALAINIYPPNTTGGVGSGVKVLTNGQPPAGGFLPIAPVDPGLVSTPTDVDVTYDGVNASVTFNQNGNTFSTGPVPLDIGGTAGTTALLGFTGATGGLQAQQQISNFSFSTLPLNVYANDVSVAAGASPTINVAATASVFNVTMGALTLGANSTLNVGADASTPVDQAFGLTFGATTLNGASTINVGVNGAGFGTVTLGAVGGPGSLTKTGAGVLVLPSAGTYSGPTNINGGRLIVTNTSGSATGAGVVNVNSGGTLGGTGFITGNIQVNSGGTIEPGSPLFPAVAPGILNVANVTFTGGALRVKLNGNTPGTGHDQLLSTGTVSIGTNVATLSTSLGYAPSGADQLVIVQAAAVSPGQFIGLPNNQVFAVGFFGAQQYAAQIHYTSNQIFLNGFTPVPEPVHMLLVGGVAGLAWRWRKRRAK